MLHRKSSSRVYPVPPGCLSLLEINTRNASQVLEHFPFAGSRFYRPKCTSPVPNSVSKPTHRTSIVYLMYGFHEARIYKSFFIVSGLPPSVESLMTSVLSTEDWLPPAFAPPFDLPHPFTRTCLLSASFREKLFSQWPHGNGLTARWIRLCRFKS